MRFFLWNRGHREAFELRYELLKRQMDLDRQFKEQLKRKNEREALNGLPDVLVTNHAEKQRNGLGPTAMYRHREHVVYCQDCKAPYLESQNHSLSCRFHTAKFAMTNAHGCQQSPTTPSLELYSRLYFSPLPSIGCAEGSLMVNTSVFSVVILLNKQIAPAGASNFS